VREYGALECGVREVVGKANLLYSERFFMKVLQLYETINVRHGLMLVGGTISGKSVVLRTLANALAL
jgi:dynein heavy chain